MPYTLLSHVFTPIKHTQQGPIESNSYVIVSEKITSAIYINNTVFTIQPHSLRFQLLRDVEKIKVPLLRRIFVCSIWAGIGRIVGYATNIGLDRAGKKISKSGILINSTSLSFSFSRKHAQTNQTLTLFIQNDKRVAQFISVKPPPPSRS